MHSNVSILDIFKIKDLNKDHLCEWLNKEFIEDSIKRVKSEVKHRMDDLESSIKMAKDHIDETISRAKDLVHEKSKKHHDNTQRLFDHIFGKYSGKKINLNDIDIVSMFKELTSKGKVNQDQAEIYVNEWENYVKEQSKSKKIIKKHILVIVSLLFLELSLPHIGSTDMNKISDAHMDNLTGQSGIAVSMTMEDDKKHEKKYDINNISDKFSNFLDTMKEKINRHDLKDVKYNMEDLAQDINSINVDSPFGNVFAKDVQVSGKGSVTIKFNK